MSKYIKLEDAIKCVNNVHNLADFIKKAICEEIEDISSADVIERKALNEFMEKYADLKIRYKEALNYVPYDFEKRFEDYDMTIDELPTIEVGEKVEDERCKGCKHYKLACDLFSEICKYEPITQTETQNSNLTFEIADTPKAKVSEDCISREWVQNKLTEYVKDYALNELDSWQNTIVEWIATDIEDAPSVVPSITEDRDTQVLDNWQVHHRNTTSAVEDCISREYILSKVYDMDNDNLVVDLKDIEDAPSVLPKRSCYRCGLREDCEDSTERKPIEGEWYRQTTDHFDYWECSECGMGVGLDDIKNYCPNCGAKMKG